MFLKVGVLCLLSFWFFKILDTELIFDNLQAKNGSIGVSRAIMHSWWSEFTAWKNTDKCLPFSLQKAHKALLQTLSSYCWYACSTLCLLVDIYIYIYSNLTVWVPSPFLLYHWFVFYLACTILILGDTLIIFTILSTVVHNGEHFGSTATLGELLRLLVWFNVILLLAGALYAWWMVRMGIFKLLKFGVLYVIIVWVLICQSLQLLKSGEGSRTCHVFLSWCLCAMRMVSLGICKLPETCCPISLIVRIYLYQGSDQVIWGWRGW